MIQGDSGNRILLGRDFSAKSAEGPAKITSLALEDAQLRR
jgi:hypothetical protein